MSQHATRKDLVLIDIFDLCEHTYSSFFPPSHPLPSVWEINFEVLGEVACLRERRRRGWRRWRKEFSLSTRQPGNKLFITLVVERGPAHVFKKKKKTHGAAIIILLFVNTFRLQSGWTEGAWEEGRGWSGSTLLHQGAAPTPLPSSLWASAMLLKRTLLSLQKAREEARRNQHTLRIQKSLI